MPHLHGPHPASPPGRRSFVGHLGRGFVAVTVLGPAVVACSSDDDDATGTTTAEPQDTTASTTESTPAAGDAAAELRFERASFGFVSAYVLVHGDGDAVVVDTGTGELGPIEAALAALGSGFDRVGDVVITHLHGDHVGGVDVLAEAASAARFHAGEADIAGIDTDVDLRPLADGNEVSGLQIIATPGHTAGHVSVFDPGSGVLVAGDALVTVDGELGGSPAQFTADQATADESVRKLAGFDIRVVLPGHGDPLAEQADAALDALAAGP